MLYHPPDGRDHGGVTVHHLHGCQIGGGSRNPSSFWRGGGLKPHLILGDFY